MSSKPPADSGKVSRVRPIQRTSVARPVTSATLPTRTTGVESTRQKQQANEQLQQIRDLELQVSTLQKKNVELQREMHEALGLQQIKSKTVEALHKDLYSKTDLERRVNDFLATVSNETLEAVAEELIVLRKKCSRSEEYLAELNERYRSAELKNKKLSEVVAELKAELAVHSEKGHSKKGEKSDELKNLVIRNTELEQKCEALAEYKEKLVKVEIEKRDLKAENTQLKGKLTTLQREKKQVQEKLMTTESDSNQKLKEMKDAQVRHLEMLSKLRRSHTKLDARYKHLLKERAQWQSLFRTANGELSRSTESLASISSVASTSVSRTSFFRDSSNLEEYNVHLESELVAVQESLKIAEKDKERLDRKLKTLAEQVVEDENLIAELDLNRTQLVEERDTLAQKCASSEEQIVVLQKTVDELREQLDTVLFENSELTLREDEGRQRELLPPEERLNLFEIQAKTAETLRSFYDNVLQETKTAIDSRLDVFDGKIKSTATACENLRSKLESERSNLQQQRLINAEHERQIEVLKNNAESLAKDLSAEVRDRSNTEMMKLQDEVNARDAKLKDYEKMQKVLKRALVENEELKNGEELLLAKIGAAEARVVELEAQLRSEQQLVTESNGKLTNRLRQAEKENDRLHEEFAALKIQIGELNSARAALEAAQTDTDSSKNEIASLSRQASTMKDEISRLSEELEKVSVEKGKYIKELAENTTQTEALRMTLAQKAQQIASLIKDLEGEREARAALETRVSELRDECQMHVDDKDSKLATFAEDMRSANRELNDVLSDKARRIEELETQVRKASDAQRELEASKAKVCELEEVVETTLKTCTAFVAALEIPVKPGLELGEFVSHMSRTIEAKWVERMNEIQTKDAELLKLKSAQEQNATFNHTIEQLKEQLEKDEHNLKRYEEALATQAGSIEKMKIERKQLEDNMRDLQARDTETIEKLHNSVVDLELELGQAKENLERLSSTEARCADLGAKLETMKNEKDAVISGMREQLGEKTRFLEEANSKLRGLEALPIMEQRLNATLTELTDCHHRIESLSKELVERDEKIQGKNQVIQELETELSERIATFDEMAKVFTLKGDEYKRVRESLSTSEERLKALMGNFEALKSILVGILSTLSPELCIEGDLESLNASDWESLNAGALESLNAGALESLNASALAFAEQLKTNASRSSTLESELAGLQKRIEEVSLSSQSQELRLSEQSKLIEDLEGVVRNSKESVERAETELAQTINSLEQMKGENAQLKRILQETQASHIAEVSNLRKLLAESESMMCGLSEQRNIELANLMEKIRSLATQKEQLESRVSEQTNAHRAEVARLSSKVEQSQECLRTLEQEKEDLENELGRTQSELDATKADYDGKASELEELTKILANKQSDMTRFEEKLHALKDRYNEKLQSLQKNLATVQSERASLTNTVSILEETLRRNEAEKEQLADQVSQLETQVTGLENRESELESSLKDKCESLEALRQEMDILEQKTQEACSQYDETERKLTEREAEVSRLVDDLANAKTELSERCEDVNSYHDHVKALAEEKVRHEEEVNALKKKINDNSEEYQAEALEMQHELSIMTERYTIKCHECEELNKEIADKTVQVQSLSERIDSLTAENRKAIDSLNETQKQLKSEINGRDLASTTTRQLELEKTQTEEKLALSLQEIASLKAVTSQNTIELNQLRDLLEESQTTQVASKQQIHDLRTQLERKMKQLSDLEGSSSGARHALEAQLETSERELETSKGELEISKRELETLKRELEISKRELEISKRELEISKEELIQSKEEHGSTIAKLNELLTVAQQKVEQLESALAGMTEETKRLRERLGEDEVASSALKKQEKQLRTQLEAKEKEFDEFRKAADLCRNELKLELVSTKTKLQRAEEEGKQIGVRSEKNLHSVREQLEEQRGLLAQREQEVELLKKVSDDFQLKCTQLQELVQNAEDEKLQAETRSREELASTLEDLERKNSLLSQTESEIIGLRTHLENTVSSKLVLENQLQSLSSQLQTKSSELSELTEFSESSCQNLKLELVATQKKLCQALEDSEEQLNRSNATAKALRKEVTEQKLFLSKTQEEVDRLRKQADHLENANLTLKKQLEESTLALDARTVELEEFKKSSDVSRNELKLELATAQKKLSRTIEEGAEIRSHLESESESLRKQLSSKELAMSQLGGGVLKIRDELNGHRSDLFKLREAVIKQQNELSALLVDLSEKVCATSRGNLTAGNNADESGRKESRLVDRCLETLKQHHVLSLAGIQHSNGENRRAPESLDTLDVHFQTFNGPTAQFVAEQQASSTAMMKKLAAAMERDDTAPDQHDLHLSNGDLASTIKVDPFDTIKQQKILIHELMAKLEMTKKVLDGEVSRRKELDERFRSWSTDTRLHNAQVSFNMSQMNQRDDTFDMSPIMDSQKQLIPETSLHVTRQFPTYVETFIRWLVTSAPQRSGPLPQN